MVEEEHITHRIGMEGTLRGNIEMVEGMTDLISSVLTVVVTTI